MSRPIADDLWSGSRVDLVAVDPGKDMLGLSFWSERRLVRAGWFPVGLAPIPELASGARVVVERPRARHPSETPGGIKGYQALIDIMLAGALYAGHCGAPVDTVFPDEWKGGTSKKAASAGGTKVYVVEQRAKKILSPAERLVVELPSAASKHHNVWDAVGIGLFALRRAGRGLTTRTVVEDG